MKLALLAILVLCMAPFQDADTPDDPGAKINWKSGDAKAEFDIAYAAYKNGEFKEAEKLFKKVVSKAKGKPSRNKVKAWQLASRGAVKLAELKADSGPKTQVLRSAQTAAKAFRGTPISKEYDAFIKELKDKLMVTLENFDSGKGPYSEKHGKQWVEASENPKLVKQGKRSLKWKVLSSPAELKIKKLPKNLEEFRAVSFWMHFEKKKGARYEVVFMGKGRAKEQTTGKTTRNGFARAKAPHNGWQKIEIPLSKFASYGKVSWDSVKDFRIRFEGQKGFTVHVDDIVLIRK